MIVMQCNIKIGVVKFEQFGFFDSAEFPFPLLKMNVEKILKNSRSHKLRIANRCAAIVKFYKFVSSVTDEQIIYIRYICGNVNNKKSKAWSTV